MISSLKSKFKSSTRRALIVGADKLAVYHWADDTLGSSYLFDASAEGQEYFGRYLSEVHNDPVYVLLDTAAEEYRLDTIPHVFGADRKALIERKQDRAFRGTPYLYTDIQGREDSGRRDDIIMLSAITNPNLLQPWLQILEEHKVPVAGVVSVPLLLQEIDNIIPEMQTNALVFSLQSVSGLRQSFFRDKSLKFSRLVKVPRFGTEPYAPILTEELEKVIRYINGAHIVDEDKPLDIYFFGNQELLTELGKTHINSSKIRYHMFDIGTLASKHGYVEQMQMPYSDKYFIYQLLKNKSKNYYASSKETRYFQMRQINKTLRIASLLFITACVFWGSFNVLDGFTYRQQYRSDAKKVDFYNDRYEVAKESIAGLAVEPIDLKVVVDTNKMLTTYKADPIDMFKLISKGLDVFPEIQISQIEWAADTNPNHKIGGGELTNIIEEVGQVMPGLGNISETETAYIYYQIALFDAYLEDFDGDYRKALDTIDRFSAAMRQLGSVYDVSVVTLPLDIGSDVSMQGTAGQNAVKSNFTVRVVLGVKDDA
jgi:hypothetical protein